MILRDAAFGMEYLQMKKDYMFLIIEKYYHSFRCFFYWRSIVLDLLIGCRNSDYTCNLAN